MTMPAKCPCCGGQATQFDDGYVQCDEDYCIWTSNKTSSGGCSHPPSAPEPPKPPATGGYVASTGTFTINLNDLQATTQKLIEETNHDEDQRRVAQAEHNLKLVDATIRTFMRELYEWTLGYPASSTEGVAVLRELQHKIVSSGWV